MERGNQQRARSSSGWKKKNKMPRRTGPPLTSSVPSAVESFCCRYVERGADDVKRRSRRENLFTVRCKLPSMTASPPPFPPLSGAPSVAGSSPPSFASVALTGAWVLSVRRLRASSAATTLSVVMSQVLPRRVDDAARAVTCLVQWKEWSGGRNTRKGPARRRRIQIIQYSYEYAQLLILPHFFALSGVEPSIEV